MYTEHFPPYSYEKDQQITGLNTELVRRSCQIAKIQCEFRLLPKQRQPSCNARLSSQSLPCHILSLYCGLIRCYSIEISCPSPNLSAG